MRPVKHYKNPQNLQKIEVTLWHLGHLLCNCNQHSGRYKMSDVVEDHGETSELLHLQKREANESNEINMPSWLSTIERSHIWNLRATQLESNLFMLSFSCMIKNRNIVLVSGLKLLLNIQVFADQRHHHHQSSLIMPLIRESLIGS